MIIPPLQKPNQTPDNKAIVPETAGWVTRLEGSIGGVLDTSTSVPVPGWLEAGRNFSAWDHWPVATA
jgi:hypothetical protein